VDGRLMPREKDPPRSWGKSLVEWRPDAFAELRRLFKREHVDKVARLRFRFDLDKIDAGLIVLRRPATDEEILAVFRDHPEIDRLRPRDRQFAEVRRLLDRPARERDLRRCRRLIDSRRKPGPTPRKS
jgi:hypothetical protein